MYRSSFLSEASKSVTCERCHATYMFRSTFLSETLKKRHMWILKYYCTYTYWSSFLSEACENANIESEKITRDNALFQLHRVKSSFLALRFDCVLDCGHRCWSHSWRGRRIGHLFRSGRRSVEPAKWNWEHKLKLVNQKQILEHMKEKQRTETQI